MFSILLEKEIENLEKKVIKAQGTTCKICGINLNDIYGEEIANSYIEVHHIKPLYLGEQEVNIDDLVTVCPNCHKMLHRNNDVNITIDDLIRAVNKYKI